MAGNPSTTNPSDPSSDRSGEQNAAEVWLALSQYAVRVTELENKINDTKKELDDSKSKLENLSKTKDNIIETIGLFIALFTFISVDFAVFREIQDLSAAVSFTFILAGLLLLFVLMLHVIIRATGKWWWIMYFLMGVAIMTLLFTGINYNHYFKNLTNYPVKPMPTQTQSLTPNITPTLIPTAYFRPQTPTR